MGEIKSVKVDNWGVFFLQKLQNFFNKTDYCDLTLQFNDNSQLKVHRLVLSACTDYFNVLEQTCEVIDDALLMPNELQADVVVPIVNFMYTGTLEFELKMYGKLLRTAKEMNMTVLLKLLEAHRRTMEGVNRAQRPTSPKNVRKRGVATSTASNSQMRPLTNSPQHRRILTSANVTPQRRLVQTKTISSNINQPQLQQYHQQVASTSILKSSTTNTSPLKIQRSLYETSTHTGEATTYESALQFKQEQHDDYETQLNTINQSTSPFEQLRKGYNNNKRPASATFISPPAKKPNIEDVKEFAEQQRMRKQIAAEFGEDQEYEGTMLDDDIHNDDDEDEAAQAVASTSTASAKTTSRQHQQGPSIIIKQEPNEKPTIVVKDSSNSKMNHAKIISEVLRQYPHLVKSNKNIKLKIMPNVGGQSQKIIVKKEQIDNISAEMTAQSSSAANAATSTQSQPVIKPPAHSQQTLLKPMQKPEKIQPPRPAQKLQTVASGAATSTAVAAQSAQTIAPAQKRRIDSKTMHALIAQGAENTTGPWLCLRCGVNGRPISIPSYRGFRRHLINTHKETIDPDLCEHCGWRSNSNRELHFHTQVEHKIPTTLYTFPDCLMCAEVLIDTNALNQHVMESHPNENQQQCIYCNKIFAKEIQLYTHTKIYHKKQAIDDGIIDYSDNEGEDEAMHTQVEEAVANVQEKQPSLSSTSMDKKIKILSDISLPSAGSLINLEQSSEAAALTTIASGIAASIGLETSEEFVSNSSETAVSGEVVNAAVSDVGGEPKFVSADGNEMVLTEEQRKEIMSQLNQEHDGGVVMVINEATFSETAATVDASETSQDDRTEEPGETVPTEDISEEHAEDDEDGYDDNNIYGEFTNKVGEEAKKESSGLEESKGSIDNLEWAENLITAHELEEESNSKLIVEEKLQDKEKDIKKDEDISNKLKELTGDWTDDEIDDEEEEKEEVIAKPIAEVATDKHSDEAVEAVGDNESILNKLTAEVAQGEIEEEKQEEEMDVEDSVEVKLTKNHPISEETEDDIDVALKSLHEEKEGTVDTDEFAGNLILENTTNIKESGSITKVNNILIEDCGEKMDVDIENAAKDDIKSDAVVICENPDAIAEGENSVASENMKEEATEDKDKLDEYINDDPSTDVKTLKTELLEKLMETDDNTKDSKVEETNSEKDIETRVPNDPETTEADQKNESDTADTSDVKNEGLEKDSNTTSIADKSIASTTNTEDKVKTLISEWGDDEDDEEIQELGSLI